MKAFLIELLIISLLMAAVVLVIGAFSKKLENRFSASCRYVIWLVVIARLALPFAGILSPALVTIPLAEEQAAESPEAWKDSFVVSGEAQKEDTPVSGNEDAGEDSQSTVPQGSTQPVKPAEPPVYNGAIEETQKSEENRFNSAIIAPVLFAVWAAGAVIFFAVNLVRYNTLKETMKRNLSPADGRVEEIYGELCREMGIKKAPALYSSPLAQSPMLCGYFKAKIIVPRLSVSEGSLRAVLTHELTHYKRGDVWVKLLALLANSIHWFNPAVYGAVSRLNREMELSCDEKTLLGADEETRVDYGRTMLDIVSRCRGGEAVLTTKFNPKKNASGERIRNILDTRKKGRGIAIIISTVAVCIIAGVIIGCEVVKADDEEDLSDLLSAEDGYTVLLSGGEGYDYTLTGKEGKEPEKYGDKVPLKLWINERNDGIYFEGYYEKAYVRDRTEYTSRDLTGDGVWEYILEMPTDGGTGVHGEEARVFDGVSLEEISVGDALGYIKKNVELSANDRSFIVSYDGKDLLFKKAVFDPEGLSEKPYIAEDWFSFSHSDDGKLVCSYLVCVAPSKAQILGNMRVTYEYSKKDKALICSEVALIGPEMCESDSENWEMTAQNATLTVIGNGKRFVYGDHREDSSMEDYQIPLINTYDPAKLPKLFVSTGEKYAAILYSTALLSIDQVPDQRVAIIDLDSGKVICIAATDEENILKKHGLAADTLKAYSNFETGEAPAYGITMSVFETVAGSFRIDTVLSTNDSRLILEGYYVFYGKDASLTSYIKGDSIVGDPTAPEENNSETKPADDEDEKPRVPDTSKIDALKGVADDVKAATKALLTKDTKTLERLTCCGEGVLSAYRDFEFGDYSCEANEQNGIDLELEITRSTLDTVPAGKYSCVVELGMMGVNIVGITKNETYLQSEGARFTYSWVACVGDPVIYTPEEVGTDETRHRLVVEFIAYLIGEATPEEYRKTAKKVFGIDNLKIADGFINEDGNVWVGGRGGYVKSFEIVSETVSGDTVTVTVQTYADMMRTVRSRVIKNTFKKVDGGLIVISSEVVEDKGLEEIGYGM